jgi:signal transduction histidine kinase
VDNRLSLFCQGGAIFWRNLRYNRIEMRIKRVKKSQRIQMARKIGDKNGETEPRLRYPRTDRELSDQIFELANQGLPRVEFLREVSNLLIYFFDCDAVEFWLEEAGSQARCETTRKPERSFRFRLIRGAKKKGGKVTPVFQKNSWLEGFCWEVLLGKVDPANHSYKRNDVFWILDFLPEDSMGESEGTRPVSERDPYPSLAVTPLRVGSKRIALLILKSERRGYFAEKEMAPCGRVAQNLGMALMNQRVQAALQERIKELTCLYQIAQVMDRSQKPLVAVFQAVVKALPPAWQYPDIASARIIFDNQKYTSPNFQESRFRQSADLIMNGKWRGSIEVVYAEEKPDLYEGPFLKEERNLIDTIARQVALFVEQRETEEEKDLLQEQLRHADRLANIGKLAAGVAHELNEPLGSILGFAQLGKKCQGLPRQAEQDLGRIVSASLHAREVIKKLMLFARQMPPRRTRLNLNQVVKEGLYLFEARCARQGIELDLSLGPDLPEIHADATQVTQVLTNLVINAIQAMPQGGRLSVVTRATQDGVILQIEDTGEGMSPEVKKQIFMPFFTTKEEDRGTGLGLAVVHGIVTAHKGSIKVDSRVGKGTRFEIQLPLAGRGERNEKNEGLGEERTDLSCR